MLYIILFILSYLVIWGLIKVQSTYGFGETINRVLKHHQNREGTPTLGGLAFLINIIFFTNGEFRSFLLYCAAVGLIDDLIKILFSYRLPGWVQYIFTIPPVFLICSGNQIGFCGHMFNINLAYYPLMVLLFGTCIIHSTNVVDGVNGLLGINAVIVLVAYILIFKDTSLMHFIPSILGFLCFNIGGKIFMGGIGSYTIGAIYSYLLITKHLELDAIFLFIIPVLSSLSVVMNYVSKKLFNYRVIRFSPVHHTFELMGFSALSINIIYSVFTIIVISCYAAIRSFILIPL